MTRAHSNDIKIGPDQWLVFENYGHDLRSLKERRVLPIDSILMTMEEDFWLCFEQRCLAHCCGLEAFDFGSEFVGKAVSIYGRERLLEKLSAVRDQVSAIDHDALSSNRLNNYLPRPMLLDLLEHLLACLG